MQLLITIGLGLVIVLLSLSLYKSKTTKSTEHYPQKDEKYLQKCKANCNIELEKCKKLGNPTTCDFYVNYCYNDCEWSSMFAK